MDEDTKNEVLKKYEAQQAIKAKNALVEKMARELVEQCAGEGLTYQDVKQICENIEIRARYRAVIRPR